MTQRRTPAQIERWAHKRQRAHGAAPVQTGAGYVDESTQAGVKRYMRALRDAYAELDQAVNNIIGPNPPTTEKSWIWINNWKITNAQWVAWYKDTIDDWLITTDDQQEAHDYGARLEKARGGFKAALGKDPPGLEMPKEEPPPASPAQTAAGALSNLVTVVELGMIGFLAYKAFDLLIPAKKGKAES